MKISKTVSSYQVTVSSGYVLIAVWKILFGGGWKRLVMFLMTTLSLSRQ